eukprot:1384132-Amorphochlora_amoeboformis.AAC.1
MPLSAPSGKERFGGEGRVSPYRLATHLSMAFILYTALLNTAFGSHTISKVFVKWREGDRATGEIRGGYAI